MLSVALRMKTRAIPRRVAVGAAPLALSLAAARAAVDRLANVTTDALFTGTADVSAVDVATLPPAISEHVGVSVPVAISARHYHSTSCH